MTDEPIRPLRVVHVLNDLRPSGAEMMLYTAGTRWERHAIRCAIYSAGSAVHSSFAPELRSSGYPVAFVGSQLGLIWAIRLWRRMRRDQPDVVHLHAERSYLLACLAARAAGVPTVRTVHNNFAYDPGAELRARWRRWSCRILGMRSIAIGDAVHVNEWERFRNPTEVIENWLDTDTLERAESRATVRDRLGIDPTERVAVCVGNCSPVKNHELLLEAVARCTKRGTRILVLHVGAENGSSERDLAARLGIADRVRFLGVRRAAEVVPAADVFVMPSRYEGLPLAALEALALGVPCVLTDVRGLRGLATMGDVRLVGLGDVDGLSDALVEPRPQGRLRVDLLARFSVGRGVAQYARVYRDAMSRQGGRRIRRPSATRGLPAEPWVDRGVRAEPGGQGEKRQVVGLRTRSRFGGRLRVGRFGWARQ